MKTKITNSQKLITVALFVISAFSLNSSKATDYYWVGGTGNWSDYANHWATTSGGVIFHITIPSPLDDVYFDINSFPTTGDTVWTDTTIINCKNMDWTGVINNPVFKSIGGGTMEIYGSFTLTAGIKWYYSGSIKFTSSTTGNTITTAGNHAASFTFDNSSGGWGLTDSLNIYGLSVINGIFATNNHNVTCLGFYAGSSIGSNHATVLLGTSQVWCNTEWVATKATWLTLDAVAASFVVVGDTSFPSSDPAFEGGRNHIYGDITAYSVIDAGDSNTYHDINMINPSLFGGINGAHNVYHDIYFSGNGYSSNLGGYWNSAHNVYFNGSGSTGAYGTFNKVVFNSDAYAGSFNIYDTLIFNNPGKTISFSDTTTVNSELVIASGTCSGLTVIHSGQAGTQAVIKKTTGNVTIDFAQLQDINATGGAAFTANNSINLGNVSGWIINSPAAQNLYWVGGTGNWNDINHWSTTSGGVGGSCTPTKFDSVFFDSNSFPSANDTVYMSSSLIYCRNMDWTGAANNPVITGTGTMEIYGSFTLTAGIKWYYSGSIKFTSSTTGNTITTAGNHVASFTFDNSSGGWGLTDSLNIYGLSVINGIFATNNHNVTCLGFYAGSSIGSNHATVLLGTSQVWCNTEWVATKATWLTLDAVAASFVVVGDTSFPSSDPAFEGGRNHIYGDITAYSVIDAGDSNTYHDINMINPSLFGGINGAHNVYHDIYFSGNGYSSNLGGYWNSAHNVYFNGSGSTGAYGTFNKVVFNSDAYAGSFNIYDTLIFNNPGKTISFSDTTTVNSELVIASGTCSGLTVIHSGQAGTQAVIKKTTGNVTIDFAQLQDINATGGAAFTANNSINLGNVSGWIINSPAAQNLYWVGGTGNWNDINHWSTTSGGVGGSCTPTKFDSVFFDSNSFPSANDTVYMSSSLIYCRNMDWTGAANNPVITGTGTMEIYGSFTLTAGIKWYYSGSIKFTSSTTGNTITTAGNHVASFTFDNSSGGWGLTDSLNIYGLSVINGIFATNNHNVTCLGFYAGSSIGSNHATVLLGTSQVWCNTEWVATKATWLTLDAVAASFVVVGDTSFPSSDPAFEGGRNHIYGDITAYSVIDAGDSNTYHDINMINPSLFGGINGAHNVYHDIYFSGNGYSSNLGGYWNSAHNVYFNGSGSTGAYGTFNKVVFNSDAYAGSFNIYDTLIFNNPGKTISFSDTTTVNSELVIASGLGGFPTPVHSGNAGTKAIISIPPGDTLCTDYLYLQDIDAINGTFYAGDNTVDLGNNTGWLWSSCTPDTSNVWPGDANYDLIADNIDVLYIGLAYGYTGTTRAGATTNWVAQPAVDWLQQFANGTNIKHADCDGNGTINATDTLAVSLNYGLTHPFKNPTPPLSNNFGTDLYFDMPPGALTPGTTVSIPIKFGTSLIPANNVYGIGFTVNYDAALIQTGTMQIDFTNSWLGTAANTIHLTKDFPVTGTIDMGYVKTDHLNSNGNGTIATLTFTVANNAAGYLFLSFSDILVLDRNEFPIPVNAQTAAIYTSINEEPSIESMINIYPNPASTMVSITDANHIIQNVKLVDMTGREIMVRQNFESVLQLDISKVMKGMYMLSVLTTKGVLNKKIQIVR